MPVTLTVGYFGQTPPPNAPPSLSLPGVLNNTVDEWRSPTAAAPRYQYVTDRPGQIIPPKLSTLIQVQVSSAQLHLLHQAVNRLDHNPGTFNLAFNNCAMNATMILQQAGVLPPDVHYAMPNQLMAHPFPLSSGFTGYTMIDLKPDGAGYYHYGIFNANKELIWRD